MRDIDREDAVQSVYNKIEELLQDEITEVVNLYAGNSDDEDECVENYMYIMEQVITRLVLNSEIDLHQLNIKANLV